MVMVVWSAVGQNDEMVQDVVGCLSVTMSWLQLLVLYARRRLRVRRARLATAALVIGVAVLVLHRLVFDSSGKYHSTIDKITNTQPKYHVSSLAIFPPHHVYPSHMYRVTGLGLSYGFIGQ